MNKIEKFNKENNNLYLKVESKLDLLPSIFEEKIRIEEIEKRTLFRQGNRICYVLDNL